MRRQLILTLATALAVAALAVVQDPAALAAPAPERAAPTAPRCQGEVATTVGTARGDFLTGTPRRDVIVGLGGDDVVRGRGGDDVVCGGAGADRLFGGGGDDRLHGGTDARRSSLAGTWLDGDWLEGGPGSDRLDAGRDRRGAGTGHRNRDTVAYDRARRGVVVDLSGRRGTSSGVGRDRIAITRGLALVGSTHDDRIRGSAGADHVTGLAGDDVISTGAGADTVYAETWAPRPGDDTVATGGGDDVVVSLAGRDRIDTGAGSDHVDVGSDQPVDVTTGPGDDTLLLDLVAESGAAGDGGEGEDLVLLRGVDLVDHSFSVDRRDGTAMLGPAGIPAFDAWVTSTLTGFEVHQFSGPLEWGYLGTDGPDVVEVLTGGGLRASTFGGDDRVVGSELDDSIRAGDGHDEVHGLAGDDECLDYEIGEC